MDGGVQVLFPTGLFVVFFVVVFAVSWALARRPLAWKLFILVAGYVFYAGWGWKFTLLLGGYTLVNYLLGRKLVSASRGRRWLLALAVAIDLLPLFIFRFYGFFAFNLSELLGGLGLGASLPILQFVVPVGISLWIGMPIMRSQAFSKTVRSLNAIYREACARNENATYLDGYTLFADSQGGYAPYLEDSFGKRRLVREGDGIHLTQAGGDRAAEAVVRLLLDATL
jgi:D-alanyl-lipoteichoic acid acyltransferase DltB (MBOAT superfamily)